MIIIAQLILLILIAIICLYIIIPTILEQIKRDENQKKKEENLSPTQKLPDFIVFPVIIFLIWILWKYKSVFLKFFFSGLVAKILFWILISGLLGVLFIVCVLYYRIYGRGVWDNERMTGAQHLKNTIPRTIAVSIILYVHLFSTSSNAQTKLIIAMILCHCIAKFYSRILKEANFADESDDQQDQTRLNNRLVASSFILCLIWFFVNQQVMYNISAIYLFILVSYYNKPLPIQEKYPVIKAPIGSPEREEVYWSAFQAIEEPPIELQIFISSFNEEFKFSAEGPTFLDWGNRPETFYDCFEMKYVLTRGDADKELVYEEEFSEIAQTKLSELRNFYKYMQRKTYIRHEYYFWWWMKDVPFYFTIRAFFDMLWDILLILFSVYYIFYFSIFEALYAISPTQNLIKDINYDTILILQDISIYCIYIVTLYIGFQDLKRPYSWLAFYYRKQAYYLYDNVHPYAIYGPTVDGPRNWQYWFFIIFGYLPARGLILLPELFDEEIRMTEGAIQLNLAELDKQYDYDDIPNAPSFWNPIVWYRFRNASPEEQNAYRAQIIKELDLKIAAEYTATYLKYSKIPKWWTHYSI